MKGLIFVPAHNSPGKHDVSGAFLPEACHFKVFHDLDGRIVTIDNSLPLAARRLAALEPLAKAAPKSLDVVAAFCHGWRDGIQVGPTIGSLGSFADRLAAALAPGGVAVLYACDTARDSDGLREDDKRTGPGGSGGFASRLFLALLDRGRADVRVYGHSTAGHTTRNPYARVWREDTDNFNGDWLVDPASKAWASWVKKLAQTPLRFEFPFLSEAGLALRVQD